MAFSERKIGKARGMFFFRPKGDYIQRVEFIPSLLTREKHHGYQRSVNGVYSIVPMRFVKSTIMNLNELLEQVDSKTTFLRYAKALADDFRDEQEKEELHPTAWLGVVQGTNGWYNHTIDGFLDQMRAWASATSTMTDKPMVPEQPSWRSFAEMPSAGKSYE